MKATVFIHTPPSWSPERTIQALNDVCRSILRCDMLFETEAESEHNNRKQGATGPLKCMKVTFEEVELNE